MLLSKQNEVRHIIRNRPAPHMYIYRRQLNKNQWCWYTHCRCRPRICLFILFFYIFIVCCISILYSSVRLGLPRLYSWNISRPRLGFSFFGMYILSIYSALGCCPLHHLLNANNKHACKQYTTCENDMHIWRKAQQHTNWCV